MLKGTLEGTSIGRVGRDVDLILTLFLKGYWKGRRWVRTLLMGRLDPDVVAKRGLEGALNPDVVDGKV